MQKLGKKQIKANAKPIKPDKPDIVIPELTLAQAVPSQVRAMPNSRSRSTRTWARSGRGGMALTEA